MTNYEWILTNCEEQVKEILTKHMGKKQGEIQTCVNFYCKDCDFRKLPNNGQSCEKTTKAWLDAEHEPLYKKGDIVMIENKVWIFVRETDDGNAILTRNVLDVDVEIGIDMDVKTNDIEKKVGNIYD